MLRPGLALYGYAPRFVRDGEVVASPGEADAASGADVEDAGDFVARDRRRRNGRLQLDFPGEPGGRVWR